MSGLVTKNSNGYVTINIPPDVARVLFPNELTDDEIGAMVQEFINNFSGLEGIQVANNLTTSTSGYVLDARQGLVLANEVKYREKTNVRLTLHNAETTDGTVIATANDGIVRIFGKHVLLFSFRLELPGNTPLGDNNENMFIKINDDDFRITSLPLAPATIRISGRRSVLVVVQPVGSTNGIIVRGFNGNSSLHTSGISGNEGQIRVHYVTLVENADSIYLGE